MYKLTLNVVCHIAIAMLWLPDLNLFEKKRRNYDKKCSFILWPLKIVTLLILKNNDIFLKENKFLWHS